MNFRNFEEMQEKMNEYIQNKQVNFVIFMFGTNNFEFADEIVKEIYKLLKIEKDITKNI